MWRTASARILFLVALIAPAFALAATCTSTGNGAWTNQATWGGAGGGCGAGGPVADDTVIITNNNAVTIAAGVTAQAASVQIGTNVNGAAALTLSAATSVLTVSGAVTILNSANNNFDALNVDAGTASMASLTLNNNASTARIVRLRITTGTATVTGSVVFTNANAAVEITFIGAGKLRVGGDLPSGGTLARTTGTVEFNGAGAQNIGAYTYNNLAVTKSSGTATLLNTVSLNPGAAGATNGVLSVTCPATCTNGTLDLSTFTADRSASGGGITVGAGARLKIGGTQTFPANYATHTLAATSIVEYSGTGQTVAAEASPGYGALVLSGSGTKTAGGGFTVRDALSITGVTFAGSTSAIVVNGNISNTGTHTATTGTISLTGGTAAHALSGTGTYANLIMNDSNGATLSASPTVSGILTLTSGVMTTGANALIASANCPGSVSRASGHIDGNLQLKFNTGAQTCIFHVGDSASTRYTPLAITFTNVSGAGSLIGSSTAADYSDANIPVNPVANVTRYWTLTLPGSGALSFTGSYSTAFTYLTGNTPGGDNDDASFAANYVVAKGSTCTPTCTWTLPTISGTPNSTSATATGMTSFSVHVVGRRVSATTSSVLASPTVVPADGTSTSTVTVTLRDPAGNVLAGRSVTLSAGGGSSTITTVTGTSDVNGQATFTVKDSTVESVTYTATSEGVAITQTATVEFAPTSFNAFESTTGVTAITGQLYTKLISTGFTIDVVAIKSGAKVGTFGGTVRVDLVTGSTGGANCPGVTVTSISTTQDFPLTSGRGTSAALTPTTATAYRDVRVRIRYPAASPVVTTCSLDNFAIRPLNFSITSTNATNTGTSGAPAIKTGVNFNLTATAAPGYDGTPTLDNTQVVGTPTAGTLSGSFGAAPVGTGISAGNSFTYSEVGNLGLNVNAVVDTSFTAVDPSSDCTADFSIALVGGKYGCKIGSNVVSQTTGSSGFGRFIPDHFALTAAGTVTQACASGGFSYMGQSSALSNVKIEARNSGNAKTVNYVGSYAKLNPVTGSFNFAARDTGTNLSSARLTTVTSGTWTAGELTLAVGTFSIARLAAPDGPYDATKIAIAPSDTDSIVFQSSDFNVDTDGVVGNDHAQIGTDTKWRFGRLRLLGAAGPTSLPLPLTIRNEYWNGSAFTTNTLDGSGCTSLPAANFTLGSYVAPLVSGDTSVNPATITFTAGVGKLQLTAPPPTHRGSVVITADLAGASATYLQGAWNGVATYNQNPSARAAFGVFGAQPKQFIYQREAF